MRRLAVGHRLAVDWDGWVRSLKLATGGDHMAIYEVVDGRPVGTWPTGALPRVYVAISSDGRCLYAGQTRQALPARLAGHRRRGTSRDWGWLVCVDLPDVTVTELDRAERSARLFFLTGQALVGRKHPRARRTA